MATHWGPMPSSPTLTLNGYNLLPSSTENVTSFYGQWSNFPGGPTFVQGTQEFNVVDPATSETVGTFGALVSSGTPFAFLGPLSFGQYKEILVTSNNAGEQEPPVGSIIASQTFGRFGWSYSALREPTGTVVSFKLLTPFGDLPIPMTFDATELMEIRPFSLGNGYSVAPADPASATILATSGVLPLFSTVQGKQVFNVYDSDGHVVGSFEGVYTPTHDLLGAYTQAILVTGNDGVNVGTDPGQVPPVGTVYNVLYEGSDDHYVLYTSMPSLSGDIVSLLDISPDGVTNTRVFPLNILDASALPVVQSLMGPNGQRFYPISDFQPVGINGLPPREVELQGYQQFGVYDSTGAQTGSFDADVATQWDLLGIVSQAILVTKVTDGTAGTESGQVPPVGSRFEYASFGNSGFGFYYSAMPAESGDVIRFNLVTPLGNIPLYTTYNEALNPDDYSFYSPFVTI
ncbi:hypothetical protein GCM10010533_01300 [Mycolicibacterium pallens]